MSEEQFTQFTNKMLSEKVFTCASGGHLLTFPIMLVENCGNVCGDCYTRNKLSGYHNSHLETILKELKIPCTFQSTGCKERIIYKDLREHERNCQFHQKNCIMDSGGCNWKGIQSEFRYHFIADHSEHVHTNFFNSFKIEIDMNSPVLITRFLRGKRECIIRVNRDNNNDSISFSIIDLKNKERDYECFIKFFGNSDNCIETKCKITSWNSDDQDVNTLNLEILRQVTEFTSIITAHIKIVLQNETKEFDEKILQHFECPVCKSIMKPPIYQCKFGHSVCSNCRPRLDKCPNCRGGFGTTRNYSLEELTTGINYQCVYHPYGCEETLAAGEAARHESQCQFKPYPCPIDQCNFTGTHSNIVKHLEELHQDKVIPADFYKATVEFRVDQMIDYYSHHQKLYLVFEQNIFRLNFKRNSDYSFWAVEVLRKQEEEDVFVYDIGIIDMRKPDRKFIRCDLCFTEINCDDLFKRCILFPNNILASYAHNGLFTYYCHIRKRE